MTTVSAKVSRFEALQEGEVLSETQYYKVVRKKDDKVQLQNDSGELIIVDKEYVNGCLDSGEQFKEERIVNRTEITNILLSNPYTAMTVNYNKKVDEKEVLKQLMETHQNTAPKDVEKTFKATLKKALEGEERKIVGRHSGNQDEFGRIQFVDMNIEKKESGYDNRVRLVDPRTTNWIIVKNVKYRVK